MLNQAEIKPTTKVYALPKKEVLDGYGYVWEYELAAKGWNELPTEKKPGVIVGHSIDGLVEVYFEAVGCKVLTFIDELNFFKQNQEP